MSQVKIIRLTEKMEPIMSELYEGTLVNDEGFPVSAPTIGQPIFLFVRTSRYKKKVPWTFRTAPIVEITLIDPGFWEVITKDGYVYSIDPDRVYH